MLSEPLARSAVGPRKEMRHCMQLVGKKEVYAKCKYFLLSCLTACNHDMDVVCFRTSERFNIETVRGRADVRF